MKKFLRSNKGITGADALLAVALATLFAGIIATLAYNIYATSSSLKRSSQALEYITSTFEYVANQYYDDVTEENIKNYINSIDGKISTNEGKPYKAQVSVTNYNQIEGNTDKLDLVKEIVMSVTYKVGNKDQKIEIKTVKSREKLEVPNRPDLYLIEITDGEYKYPIKYLNGAWKITTINDSEWYNYNNGIWATVLVSNKEKLVGDIVSELDENDIIRLWVPRFEYNPTPSNQDGYKVNFLYKNTNKLIANENGTTKIENGALSVPGNFTISQNQTKKELTGIWISKGNLQEDPYKYLNKTKYKLDETKYDGKLWKNL